MRYRHNAVIPDIKCDRDESNGAKVLSMENKTNNNDNSNKRNDRILNLENIPETHKIKSNDNHRIKGINRLIVANPIRGKQRQQIKGIGERNSKREIKEQEQCICYLMTASAFLSILVAGGTIYLASLFADRDLPSFQLYNDNNTAAKEELASFPVEMENDNTVNTDDEEERKLPILPSSSIYVIPNSMPHIGDKSDGYVRLRQDWDNRYSSVDLERSLLAVREARDSVYERMRAPPFHQNYDINDCPDYPPPGYPREYKTIDILHHWPPTQSLPVGGHGVGDDENDNVITAHLGICIFDYSKDYIKILRYRSKEVPFVVRNDPNVAETVERWNDEKYRRKLFGGLDHTGSGSDSNSTDSNRKLIYHRAEQSVTNQILFRKIRKRRSSQRPHVNSYDITQKKENNDDVLGTQSPPLPPPTKLIPMTYEKWYNLATKKEKKASISTNGIQYYDTNQVKNKNKSSYYYYLRLVGCGEKKGCEKNSTEYLFDELPFFQPRRNRSEVNDQRRRNKGRHRRQRHRHRRQHQQPEELDDDQLQEEVQSLYLVEPEQQRGIHCRFGMPGMIAANHFDASRNTIAILGGERRYILSRPEQCLNMGLFHGKHESARHSKVDWTTASADYYHGTNFNEDYNNEGVEDENIASTSSTPVWREYKESLSLLVNNATSTEVVLQAGDVLYLPSYWFHYIISLTVNMQCNTRSGRNDKDNQVMTECGFPPPK
mmetsp:Transcript_30335/g.34837  ORF Transcript_30335/g.34837 Transcript_30335/m.34837 type:complete len:718 (-) Transcript_30335:95-2248(-)